MFILARLTKQTPFCKHMKEVKYIVSYDYIYSCAIVEVDNVNVLLKTCFLK